MMIYFSIIVVLFLVLVKLNHKYRWITRGNCEYEYRFKNGYDFLNLDKMFFWIAFVTCLLLWPLTLICFILIILVKKFTNGKGIIPK